MCKLKKGTMSLILFLSVLFVPLFSNAEDVVKTKSSINTVSVNANSELLIKLTSPAQFTSYKLPYKFVLELSQTSVNQNSSSLVQVNKGNFKTLNMKQVGANVLIEIDLVQDTNPVLNSKPGFSSEFLIS